MSVKRALALAALCTACCSGPDYQKIVTCQSSEQCGEGEVCFSEGCADPGRGVVIEVTGGNSSGLYEQDIDLDGGTVGSTLDLQVNGALAFVGELQRERSAGVDPSNRVIYAEPVQIRAIGSSALIPGVSRSYQASFTETDRGVFSMPVGAGLYSVTALPANSSVPPLTVGNVSAAPGKPGNASFAFPSVEGTVVLAGRLVKAMRSAPASQTPLDAPMDLQVIDSATGQALSQKSTVSANPGAGGDFIISVSPRVRALTSVQVVATPRDSNATVPTKSFDLTSPLPALVTLELGEYGTASAVRGTAIDFAGTPIVGASVVFDGVVTGGGRFRSKVATTDEAGVFSLESLDNVAGQAMTATVSPPRGHPAAVTQVQLDLRQPSARTPRLMCGQRVVVSGVLKRPSGTLATGVVVHATPQSTIAPRALPFADVETVTDEKGAFTLALDTGAWRLDFLPGEDLPRSSRLVSVIAANGSDGSVRMAPAQSLDDIILPNGRRVSGLITNAAGMTVEPLGNASIRFFRVLQVGGKSQSILLDSTIADSKGKYSVTLPAR